MDGERIWGSRIWVWRVQAALALGCLVLFVVSQTVSGRIFAVMVVVAQAFYAWAVHVSWNRAEQLRASDDTGLDDGVPWF